MSVSLSWVCCMVLVVAAVGVSGSGKTTVLEYLIRRLSSEGFRVGAVKHIHREDFTIDMEGTNTWRFAKAGAKVTVAVSPDEIAVIKKEKTSEDSLDEILALLKKEQLDVVFVEGFHGVIAKRSDIHKIVTAKGSDDLKRTLSTAVEPVLGITGLVAKDSSKIKSNFPIFSLPEDRERLVEIVRKCLVL